MAGDPFKEFSVKRKKGETIYVDGDLGSEMYVVQSGAVRIFRTIAGVKQELAIMEKGDFFGEIAVLEGLPRTASAEALDDSELIEINSTTFDTMIRANIEIAVRMLRKLSNRLQEANRKIEILSRATTAGRRSTQAAPRPIGEVEVPERALALLVLEGGSRHFPITTETALIGRYDPVTGTRPEIDLTQVDINRSVSRRHARIVHQEGAFMLSEEVGALNGTFVNAVRLSSGTPTRIVSGDKIGLGMVALVFKTSSKAAGKKTASAGRS